MMLKKAGRGVGGEGAAPIDVCVGFGEIRSEIRRCATWRKCEMLLDLQQCWKHKANEGVVGASCLYASSFQSFLLPSSIFPSLLLLPPSFLPCFIPSFLAFLAFLPSVLPSFLPSLLSFLPSFLPSLPPSFLPSFLASFPPSLLPSFPPSLLPSFPPSLLPPPSFLPSFNQKEIGKKILTKAGKKKS